MATKEQELNRAVDQFGDNIVVIQDFVNKSINKQVELLAKGRNMIDSRIGMQALVCTSIENLRLFKQKFNEKIGESLPTLPKKEAEVQIFTFRDGDFRFCTAEYGSWNNDYRIVFRVRIGTTPAFRAQQKKIKSYDAIRYSSSKEITAWLASKAPDYRILGFYTQWLTAHKKRGLVN